VNRLEQTFERLRARQELGLFPYLTVGFPNLESCGELLAELAAAGADGIELGVPFSDPLADGVTLQRVGAQALEQGASIAAALGLLRTFRTRSEIPVVLMSYYNPMLAYGLERLVRDGAAAGLDGFIVPDLPLEEAEPLRTLGEAQGLRLVSMVAPTSTDRRLDQAARLAGGFIYCVALVGVTGARQQLSSDLPALLERVRARTPVPLVVGFGISRPEHVQAMRGQADGVIVASALADLIESTPSAERNQAVRAYVERLKAATRPAAAPAPGR
jgi:tryptophan synthase alpha chain